MSGSWDPRLVAPVETRLAGPAIDAKHLTAQALQQRFSRASRTPARWAPGEASGGPVRAASVLIALIAHPPGMTVLLTRRAAHLSSHADQIAFPGGKADAADADAIATALREAQEEVGLPGSHVQVLGVLPVYAMGLRYAVTPVVGLVQPDFELRVNAREVAQVFEVPLAFLMNPAHHRRRQLDDGRQWFSMPYQDAQGQEHDIWGATAGMLRSLYRFLLA